MASFPHDQFDEIPTDLARIGAHRAPAKRGLGWVRFGWAALATAVLVVAGLFGLSLLNPASKVDPKLNLTISVLNGSSTDGLQDKAGDAIKAAGWPDPGRATSTARSEKT